MDRTEEAREAALKRLKAKRDFRGSVVAYVLVNSLLVVVWAVGDRGVFWPVFPMAGWGLALGFQAWYAYGAKPVSEDDIHREMERRS